MKPSTTYCHFELFPYKLLIRVYIKTDFTWYFYMNSILEKRMLFTEEKKHNINCYQRTWENVTF